MPSYMKSLSSRAINYYFFFHIKLASHASHVWLACLAWLARLARLPRMARMPRWLAYCILSGRNNKKKDSAKLAQDMHLDFDLVDIWRIRNPTASRFAWHQKTPVKQRRLDYWLISDSLYKKHVWKTIKVRGKLF